jgi:hypothetical protein
MKNEFQNEMMVKRNHESSQIQMMILKKSEIRKESEKRNENEKRKGRILMYMEWFD